MNETDEIVDQVEGKEEEADEIPRVSNETVLRWAKITREILMPYKLVMYRCRRMLYGDMGVPGLDLDLYDINDKPERREGVGGDLHPKIHAREMDIGRSNFLLQQVNTLTEQVAITVPDISISNINTDIAILMKEYLSVRLSNSPRGCNAQEPMKKALMDCMSMGLGVVGVVAEYKRPYVRYYDPLDILWDPFSPTLHESQQVLVSFSMPTAEAVKKWGAEKFEDLLGDDGEPRANHESVVIAYYFNCETEQGCYKAFRLDCLENDEIDCLADDFNPHYTEIDGVRQSYLPIHFMQYLPMPGSACPMGLVQQMAPAQAMLAKAEQRIMAIFNGGAGFFHVPKDVYEEDDLQKLKRGEPAEMLMGNSDKTAVWVPGGEISALDLQILQMYKQMVTGVGGATPFAGGQRVENVKFSSEVSAIEANSNLRSATIARNFGEFWTRVARNLCEFAANIEEAPLTLTYKEKDITFGLGQEGGLLRRFFNLKGSYEVSEDSMMYRNRSERMRDAQSELMVAASQADIAPQSRSILYTKFLKAAGERDPQSHFAMPQAMITPQGQQALAAASTEG